MKKPSVQFFELSELVVGVSPKSGSTSFARAYPEAVRLDPVKNSPRFMSKPCVYYMRNPLSRLVSAYKFFLTTGKETKHTPGWEILQNFEHFVDYCIDTDNQHWNPVFPYMGMVSRVKHIKELKNLVGNRWENKSGHMSVFINHEAFAKVAAYWGKDFLIYNQIVDTE